MAVLKKLLGIINLGKLIPVVGDVISVVIDFGLAAVISENVINLSIEDVELKGDDLAEGGVIEMASMIEEEQARRTRTRRTDPSHVVHHHIPNGID